MIVWLSVLDNSGEEGNRQETSSIQYSQHYRGKEVSPLLDLQCQRESDGHAVVYVGHLPQGFNEEELRGFFSQFGDITNLRVARSKKASFIRLTVLLDWPLEGLRVP